MEGYRLCKHCKKKKVIRDEISGNSVCESCGIEEEFDNYQTHFGGINGPQGTFVRIGSSVPNFGINSGDFSYKENKIYHAQKDIEDVTSKLGFSSVKSSEVKRMVEEITEGEFGIGIWFPILIGACSYIVMRKENLPLPMAEVASVIACDLHELGRMVVRVIDFLKLDLPEFDVVSLFERAIRTSPSFAEVSSEKIDKMVQQGRFLVQCLVKWFLTTGRQPIPVVAAVLVFVAELNQIDVQIEDIAKEIHAGVATSRRRHKELQETLVKVAQALPWGKNVTVKNIVKNAPFVIQYMEMKSRLKPGEKRKNVDEVGFDVDEMVGDCLRKETVYTTDDCCTENDSPYFEIEDRNGNSNGSLSDLDMLKISQECLSKIYTKFSNGSALVKSMDERDEGRSRKRRKGLGLQEYKDWWKGNSDLSKKLSLQQVLDKNVGYSGLPPSFVAGNLACKRRREKIKAAKLRIDEIMQPAKTVSSEKKEKHLSECLQSTKETLQGVKGGNIDWEDCIIELLLLHQVKEDEIEQGNYNRLLDLYVFDSVSAGEMFGHGRRQG
ncbi:Transcription factor TFIIB [Macleaya cordata]|uniref:Transcription factor TFIIB n=1 Tax=Macleaya cordata TaxID=56857 RepID=A0A200QWE1_MACCD|nr:Transcription factor TFIIB [Macleaya cordata]